MFAANNFTRRLEELRSQRTSEDFGSREHPREAMVEAYGEKAVRQLEQERGRPYPSLVPHGRQAEGRSP